MKLKYFAFTLAETLITLGIIGVVAALTIPALINKTMDMQFAAKWKKEYSTMSNIFNKILAESIPICSDYHSKYGSCSGLISEDFIDEFLQNVKVSSACGVGNNPRYERCDMDMQTSYKKNKWKYPWSGISGYNTRSFYAPLGLKSTNKIYINNYNFSQYAFLLSDGAVVYFGGSHGGPWIIVDVNNFTGGPNAFGRDVFVFKVQSNIRTNEHGVKPMGAEGTFNKTANGDTCKCGKEYGVKTANYIAGAGGSGEVISGACCSAKYIYERK